MFSQGPSVFRIHSFTGTDTRPTLVDRYIDFRKCNLIVMSDRDKQRDRQTERDPHTVSGFQYVCGFRFLVPMYVIKQAPVCSVRLLVFPEEIVNRPLQRLSLSTHTSRHKHKHVLNVTRFLWSTFQQVRRQAI